MTPELKEKLAKLGINLVDENNVTVEAINIVVERDRQDVGH